MSHGFRLTPSAIEDLDSIWCFIAQDNLDAAGRVEAAIIAACGRLARYPQLGNTRPDLTPLPVKFWTVPKFPNYVIVYRKQNKMLQVIAILHGKRDTGKILTQRL
jgi:plasmid stabilization system protein ParE